MEYNEDILLSNKKYLSLLALTYPTIQAASTEIINLRAILNLPKGTEHFISDIHGEYEAFAHILKNASGSVKRKINESFGDTLTTEEKKLLATIIYYPQRKLIEVKRSGLNTRFWYKEILQQLIVVCRLATSKYTRSKVRKALPKDFEYIIDELINTDNNAINRQEYFGNILDTIIEIDRADDFIIQISHLIQRMIIDKLHIIGDIYDRGPGACAIMDDLMEHHDVDFQWGNHDILWMGAANGQLCCIANVIRNCIRYGNFDTLEEDYGINVRPLAVFAMEQYANDPCTPFTPKQLDGDDLSGHDQLLAAKIHKAISVIQFKLEGQLIKKHPEYEMQSRLFLDTVDLANKKVTIDGQEYRLNDNYFPTFNPRHPYDLTYSEEMLMDKLRQSFLHNQKLQEHIKLLFEKGSMYKICNNNLMYHGCVPLNEDGSFGGLTIDKVTYTGKALLDMCDKICRQGAYGKGDVQENGLDFMWFLWCGPKSPLNGKNKMSTFERCFIDDPASWKEEKDPYYRFIDNEDTANMILKEFGVNDPSARIVNGHVPVKISKGESPIKANGKLLIIDGGLSKAYQSVTGIAGYTLVSNSHEIVLSEHQPFSGVEKIISNNSDMHSQNILIETFSERVKISHTDIGHSISTKIIDLEMLLQAYRKGIIKQNTK
ncbi:MAG: fructose-1,6-bisphosphatase [Angelakisella sp.]|nr:fructose-1,6-bisphosphatase [Angelakisella sp.]